MPIFHQGEVITSRQNRRIVELCKLDDRRARDRAGLFRFDGVKLLAEAQSRGVALDAVYLRAGTEERVAERLVSLGGSLEALDCPIFALEDGLFEKISQENAPDGVISVAKYLDKCHKMIKIYNRDGNRPTAGCPILLLESVRDPLNVGAIIRSAAALGVSELILSADCADIYHPRTVRAAMGPLFSLPITRVEDMAASVTALREAGHTVLAAALDDTALSLGSPELSALLDREGSTADRDRPAPCAVIGNEGHGLSPAVIEACDHSVYIPMQAGTESLNAGVAAALIMWELRPR